MELGTETVQDLQQGAADCGRLSSTLGVYERATDQAQIDTAVSAQDNIWESSNPPSVLELGVFVLGI